MKNLISDLFLISKLSVTLSVFVLIIGITIGCFSSRYLRGDTRYQRYLSQIAGLVISVLMMINANNFLLFGFAWMLSSLFIIQLIKHKPSWKQAAHSAHLAKKYLFSAGIFICAGLTILSIVSEYSTFSSICYDAVCSDSLLFLTGITLIMIGALIQSGLIPFHCWLISSANAPTPTSALMHAGIVNGGGIILIRLSSLYIHYPLLLKGIFVMGLLSAIFGTLAKLVQNDVKRMLAFSTVSQMGFMMLECGLGLFSIAIAHICWHGFFKAYLFLSVGSEPYTQTNLKREHSWFGFLLCLLFSVGGVIIFEEIGGFIGENPNSSWILLGLIFIFLTEIGLSITEKAVNVLTNLIGSAFIVFITAVFYGIFLRLTEWYFQGTSLFLPQSLNELYIAGTLILMGCWFILHCIQLTKCSFISDSLKAKLYVWLLNFSQPHSKTITSIRTHYQF